MKAKYLTIICTAFALAVTGSVAIAQSGSETKTPEIELSPEGFKILCERFPLNSRCPGGASVSTPPTGTTTTPETEPSPTPETEPSPTPSAPDPGTTDVPPTDTTSPGVPGGAGDTINNPSTPPADSGTPSTDTTSPSNPGGTGNGTIPEGSPPPTTP